MPKINKYDINMGFIVILQHLHEPSHSALFDIYGKNIILVEHTQHNTKKTTEGAYTLKECYQIISCHYK